MTNASDSFDKMKQEMQAIKTTSNAELQAIQRAIKKIESDIQGNSGNSGGGYSGGNWRNKSAMEHKAIANLKTLGERQAGIQTMARQIRQCHGPSQQRLSDNHAGNSQGNRKGRKATDRGH